MLNRFAFVPVILALSFSGCKKSGATTPTQKTAAPSPTASVTAAATPAPAQPTRAAAPAKPAIDQNAEVVIFGYHRFVQKVKRPDTEITPQAFEAQMQELKNKNISVIPMQDFLAWRRGTKAIPSHSAIITIDDGYKSGYEVAWPILKKYGYPVTMFVYIEGIKPGKYSGGESMSWEQLAEMRDAGVDIQSHTETHQDLRKPPYDRFSKRRLSKDEYEPWLENEVGGSKQIIEQKLGVKVNCFAVPYGYYNEHVKEIAMKAGYEALFTVYGQPVTMHTPLDSVGRYMIEANKPKTFADAVSAASTTASGPAVAEVSTAGMQTQPADGETIKSALPLIRANLASLGPIDPGSVQMRVSGLGLVKASFDEKNSTVAYQVTERLHDKNCTVIVSATSGGKKVETHWAFKVEETGAPAPTPKK